jgi:hypothetical protein
MPGPEKSTHHAFLAYSADNKVVPVKNSIVILKHWSVTISSLNCIFYRKEDIGLGRSLTGGLNQHCLTFA